MFLQDHASGAPGEGCRWSADLDLEKFSDRVHHDRLVERIGDTALLTSGVLEGGLVLPTNVSPAIGYLILKHHQATIGQISESFIPNRTARAYVENKQL